MESIKSRAGGFLIVQLSAVLALVVHGVTTDSASSAPACMGREATIVGDAGDEFLRGTHGPDVIAARGGADVVRAHAGNDRICLGRGSDRVGGGRDRDKIEGGRGSDIVRGRRGRDYLKGGYRESDIDRLFGGGARDTCIGGERYRNCERREIPID